MSDKNNEKREAVVIRHLHFANVPTAERSRARTSVTRC
jgi:hypothetical protein